MKEKNRKKEPLQKVLQATSQLSPDDLEVGEESDVQVLVEQKDDKSPDDPVLKKLGKFQRLHEK